MPRIALSAESTIDLTKELIEKNDIHIVPFTVILGNKSGYDGEITSKEIINYVKKHDQLPKTSAVNTFQYKNHFEALLKEYDYIIHITLSSEISSAYNNAIEVAKEMKNVYVIDSQSLSTGIALLALYARKLIDQGMEPFDIVNAVVERRSSVQASFILSRLDYLYKGGRCNSIGYLASTLLKIRPQIIVLNGRMESKKKYVGKFDKSLIKYVNDTLEYFNNPDLENVFITSTTSTKEQNDTITKILKERGFKNVYPTNAGATITSHCGENCLGILYINDGDKFNKEEK